MLKCFQFHSYHSDCFRALFSSNYKEGQMHEIPIGEVSFENFAFFRRNFYPKPVYVTDATVEKILKMARRFLVSSVILVTEHHLLNMSKIKNEKMLWLADEYDMPKFLEKCIRWLDLKKKRKNRSSMIPYRTRLSWKVRSSYGFHLILTKTHRFYLFYC